LNVWKEKWNRAFGFTLRFLRFTLKNHPVCDWADLYTLPLELFSFWPSKRDEQREATPQEGVKDRFRIAISRSDCCTTACCLIFAIQHAFYRACVRNNYHYWYYFQLCYCLFIVYFLLFMFIVYFLLFMFIVYYLW
jgi:hypothetical protein